MSGSKKFRVWVECTTWLYNDVEASSEEEAMEMARDLDGSEFQEEWNASEWNVRYAEPVKE